MTITETFSGWITDVGSFEIPVDPDLSPHDDVLEKVQEFDHLVILPTWHQHPDAFLDSELLAVARYAGPILEPERSLKQHVIRGQGMAHHLGDSEAGPVIDVPLTFVADVPTDVLTTGAGGLLQYNIIPGTITDGGREYTVTDGHFAQTIRAALDIYLPEQDLHARVNPNGTLDAGPTQSDEVFRVVDKIVVATRDGSGQDPGGYVGVHCVDVSTKLDATRIAMLAEYVDMATFTVEATATASAPYLDIRGNALARTIVIESLPDDVNATNYMGGLLDERTAVLESNVTSDNSEAAYGSSQAGDWIWMHDPPSGMVDYANQLTFRGAVLHPIAARIIEQTWPTMDGMGYYIRHRDQDPDGVANLWTDITPVVVKEYVEGQSTSTMVVRAYRPSEAPPPE